MIDLVPELLEQIENMFFSEIRNNQKIKELRILIDSKNATYEDANEYAIEIGKALSKSLTKHLTVATLPDGKMYFNVADRILNKTLRRNFDLVASYTKLVQDFVNESMGLSMSSITPNVNTQRVKSLVDKISNAIDFEEVSWVLDEPIINFTHQVVNDSLEANANFQNKLGLRPVIKRTLVGGACDWCVSLAGTYTYPDVPDDVYKRHDRCRCTVEYIKSDIRKQDVWTKSWNRNW